MIDLQALTAKWREDQDHLAYVEAIWNVRESRHYIALPYHDKQYLIHDPKRMQAAAEFTAEHCEEVRRINEEICFMGREMFQWINHKGDEVPLRIMDRLQKALAEARKGMKE